MKESNYLVLSDTHGGKYYIEAVLKQINFRPTAVLFLGDVTADLSVLDKPQYAGIDRYAVRGNCDDLFTETPETLMLDLDGCRVMLMHGHRCFVESGHGAAIAEAKRAGADVLLFGHTHIKCAYSVETDGEGAHLLLVGNPGSLRIPRDGGGQSFGVLTIRDGVPLFSHGELT